jgi:transposase
MSKVTVGVDIAKLKFDVARLCEGKYKHAKFTNDVKGYADFILWLTRFGDKDIRICMEATGAYSLPLAELLADRGYFVSVINPAFMPFGCKSTPSERASLMCQHFSGHKVKQI